ncbi:MAG: HD-GYP domain-containing protein [Brevinematales bacterium]|nr:HD-GYP domain-containing protein [Brevinematales bacterium]
MPDEKNEFKVELYVKFLYPGIILKGDAYTYAGEKVGEGGSPFTNDAIQDLKSRGISKVFYTRSKISQKRDPKNPMVSDEQIKKSVDISREIEQAVTSKSIIPEKGVNEVVDGFINNISSSEGTVLNLLELKEYDDYTYTHSINVCLLSILFAKKMNYNEKGLKIVGIGALLHDIGKQMISKEILNKPFNLTRDEFEIMKKHPIYGYELIRSQSSYGTLIQKVVLLHHEKYIGKGYPFGLRGEQIGEIAQIVSLADNFDAITSERVYKPARPYWYALSTIKKESGTSFAPRLARAFVEDMPKYLTESEIFTKGGFVVLNTGEVGEVIDYRFPQSLKPVVNIFINSKKEIVRYPIPVNLEFDDSRTIENVLEDNSILERLRAIKEKITSKKEKSQYNPVLDPEIVKTVEEKVEEVKEIPPVVIEEAQKPEQAQIDKDLFIDNETDLK